MVGCPSYFKLRMIYQPALKYGQIVTVQGSATGPANNFWIVYLLTQELDSLKPNGMWFTTAQCARQTTQPPIQ